MLTRSLFLLSTFLIFGTSVAFAQAKTQRPPLPRTVVNFDENKYPYPMYLLDVPSVKKRVRALLGKNYSSFTEAIDTQEPLEKRGSLIVGSGCAKGLCTVIEAIVIVDVANNSITIGMFDSSGKQRFRYFSETPDAKPVAAMRQWEKDLNERSR